MSASAFIARLKGRRDMNRRTAQLHPDPDAARHAVIRALAYELALQDAEELLLRAPAEEPGAPARSGPPAT